VIARQATMAGLAVVAAFAACSRAQDTATVGRPHATTSGAIAIANLDHQIAQLGDQPGVEDLLLTRARFLGDHDALDRACRLAEPRIATAGERLRRARARSAVHRFADALDDLAAAERGGGDADEIAAARAAIFVTLGRADEVIPQLEAAVTRRPGFASLIALAGAYAAVGRIAEADRWYVVALGALGARDTTSPFPYAWTYFVRGTMWSEHGGAPALGAALHARALGHLPAFAAASLHLAELEAARGDPLAAIRRLERAVAHDDPEALGLVGALHLRTGQPARGQAELARAGARYEALLARHPLAFADHAAELYLGLGANPERAFALAEQNLAARQTERAFALAIAAARATSRAREADALQARLAQLRAPHR